jgi:anti-sigma regulatory factor (Ser/Thr protein kinase)
MKTAQLRLDNRISELDRLRGFLENTVVKQWSIPPAVGMSVNLALEEAFANIVQYAFDDQGPHEIELLFELRDKQLVITITDDGHTFDPTKKDAPDTTLPAGDRPVGGLGILLVRKIMDEVWYKRIDNINQLTLTKKIN